MTSILCSVAVLLCVVTVNEACSCPWLHLQGHFCLADFVIRAKVMSQEVKNDSRVFNLEILQTFKGASRLNQHMNGSGQGSLFAKAYTDRDEAMCGVSLTDGTAYLLGGYITNRLQLFSCDLNEEWSQVTSSQRVGLSRVYSQNCECQISPDCDWNGCTKLKGCAEDSMQRHQNSYCIKNADGATCSWTVQNCTSIACEQSQASTSKATMTFYFVVLLYLLIFV